MTTIINASNGSTSGLITTADASGVLQLQTNNGTPALTLNTTQALGVGSTPTYGTSGQVLTSAGSGAAPTWSSPTTNLATGVTGTLGTANGGTNSTATPTAGGVVYGNGSAQAYTAAGTSGQVLTSAGSGTPTWTTPSAGAMTLISTLTANNTATSLSWSGLSGYDKYMLIIENLLSHGSSLDQYFIYFGTGSGPTYATSGYTRSVMYYDGTSTINGAANGLSSSQSGIIICALGNYSSSQTYPYGLSGSLTISGITSNSPRLEGTLSYPNSGGNYWANDCIGGANFSISSSSTPVTAIKIASSTPVNLQSGSVSLYGISS